MLDKNSQGLSNLHSILDRSKLPTEIISVDDDQSQGVYDLLYTIDVGYALKDDSDGARGAFIDYLMISCTILLEKFLRKI